MSTGYKNIFRALLFHSSIPLRSHHALFCHPNLLPGAASAATQTQSFTGFLLMNTTRNEHRWEASEGLCPRPNRSVGVANAVTRTWSPTGFPIINTASYGQRVDGTHLKPTWEAFMGFFLFLSSFLFDFSFVETTWCRLLSCKVKKRQWKWQQGNILFHFPCFSFFSRKKLAAVVARKMM